MLYFKVATKLGRISRVLEILEEYPRDREDRAEFMTRNDITSYEEAERLAHVANVDLNETFLPVDKGAYVSPRYDVIRAPKIGDPVSYGFNGDYYPCGTIERFGGQNFKVIYTSDGTKFNRRRKTATWVRQGGTFCMVRGHRDELNPSF